MQLNDRTYLTGTMPTVYSARWRGMRNRDPKPRFDSSERPTQRPAQSVIYPQALRTDCSETDRRCRLRKRMRLLKPPGQ